MPRIKNEIRDYARATADDLVRPYAGDKTDLVLGLGRELGSRFFEWFMSERRIRIRRERRAARRQRRQERRARG